MNTFEMHDDILVNTLGPEEVSRPKDATHTEDATTDNDRCFNCAWLLIYFCLQTFSMVLQFSWVEHLCC